MSKYLTLTALSLLSFFAPCFATATPLTVTSSVTSRGALSLYDYTIINSGLPNLQSVTLTTPAQASAVQNLTAPSGYSAFFDAGIGLVDFVVNSRQFPIGSSVGGFTLESPFDLDAAPYSALSLDANQNPVVTTGAVTPTPEPATFGLLAVSLLSVLSLKRAARK